MNRYEPLSLTSVELEANRRHDGQQESPALLHVRVLIRDGRDAWKRR